MHFIGLCTLRKCKRSRNDVRYVFVVLLKIVYTDRHNTSFSDYLMMNMKPFGMFYVVLHKNEKWTLQSKKMLLRSKKNIFNFVPNMYVIVEQRIYNVDS